MKNLDVTVFQIVLLAVGGFYVYQAIGLFAYNRLNYQPQSSFLLAMFIGVVLLGLALALQEVRRYRVKKSFLNTFLRSETNASEKNRSPMILAICPECKNRIPSESKYCPECGTDLHTQ